MISHTAPYGQLRFTPSSVVRVCLDVADALPLISERAGGRPEVPVAAVLTLLFIRRDSWPCDGYRARATTRRGYGINHLICCRVYHRNRARNEIRHVYARAIRR